MPAFPGNWLAGWLLVFVGLLAGAVLGLFFHRDDFLGGYGSFRRRIVRLGHIALVALGMLNVVFSIAASPLGSEWAGRLASLGFLAGGVTMPLTCFLTGWHEKYRHGFAVPVAALLVAVTATLWGGLPCVLACWRMSGFGRTIPSCWNWD